MQGYWIKFTDGSRGYCEGESPYDAVQIAEKISGLKVEVGANEWQPELDKLPYPSKPVIWQFDHPVHGKCPLFCHAPNQCKGKTSCPQSYACTE